MKGETLDAFRQRIAATGMSREQLELTLWELEQTLEHERVELGRCQAALAYVGVQLGLESWIPDSVRQHIESLLPQGRRMADDRARRST